MGLGLTMCFPVGEDEQTGRGRYEHYFRSLPSAVPGFEPRFFSDDTGFRVKLTPFEEELYGAWEDGILRVSAKTSDAGPGYHAWLIDAMDSLTAIETEDETGYYEQRDFSALQHEMAAWLKGLSRQLMEMSREGNCSNIAVSCSIDSFPENSEHFTCCPLGYFEKEFFERVTKSENGSDALGEEFFIWWNRPQDAVFHKNTALHLIWNEINWLSPETDDERRTLAITLACLENAYALDPDLNYPAAEWMELARLSDDDALAETLRSRFGDRAAQGAVAGYRRGMIASLENGWHIRHSGQMHFDREEDGSPVWWDDARTIRASTISVTFRDEVENQSEALLASAMDDEEGYVPLTLHDAKIAAVIQHSEIEEDGEPLLQTRLYAALDSDLLVLSLFYESDADREWAVGVCASVTR